MPKAAELKRGSVVAIDGEPHAVEDLQVQTPSARGGATLYKFRFRGLVSKQKVDRTFRGDDVLPDVDFERRAVQFSYSQADRYVFTDLSDYSEIALVSADIEDEKLYLTEEMEGVHALVSGGRVLGIELPPVAELEVTVCDPSIRGASATARTKPATLSTGLTVQVPEYLEQGERVRVDTRTGKFLSRA
jgi:elongation factor P